MIIKKLKGSVRLIIKLRDNPTHLLQIEALNRRTPPHHRKKELIRKQAMKLRTGYNGEKSLDFTLSFLPSDTFRILHYLRIQDTNGHFQIDTLILSPYFALIIEVKNVFGTITFDDMGQAIRTRNDGIEEGFNNPVEQVNLQEYRLRRWLKRHNSSPFPIEKLVVYSHSNTILKNTSNNKIIAETVIHKESLLSKIEEYSHIHSSASLTETEISRLGSQLIAAHTPENVNIMEKYDVKESELLRGVICPDCGTIPMQYWNGRWICKFCGCISKTAHLQTLEDYRLLIGNTIKNRQARDFLGITSIHVTKKLLMAEGFQYFGETSARTYKLDEKRGKS